MNACFWYIHTNTHTRAFKVQHLTSAKSFNQSRLDFLPELGYVYICYSILKPSNYVLSCTPSHTLVWLVWLHQRKLALHMSWYPHRRLHTLLKSLCWSVADNLAFHPSPMLEILTFKRIKLTCVSSEFIWVFLDFIFFLRWDLKCFCVLVLIG